MSSKQDDGDGFSSSLSYPGRRVIPESRCCYTSPFSPGFDINGTLSSKFALSNNISGGGGGGGSSSSSGGSGGDNALLLVGGGGMSASLKESRQQVLNFINVHKIKLENCYICDLCNKQSADNSNMNKHIEFTHATELQAFLQNLSAAIM